MSHTLDLTPGGKNISFHAGALHPGGSPYSFHFSTNQCFSTVLFFLSLPSPSGCSFPPISPLLSFTQSIRHHYLLVAVTTRPNLFPSLLPSWPVSDQPSCTKHLRCSGIPISLPSDPRACLVLAAPRAGCTPPT